MPSKNSLTGFKASKITPSVLPDTVPVDDAPVDAQTALPASDAGKPKVKRVNKGFKVEESRARRWDILVAHQKGHGKNGPMLIDEALDDLFSKYNMES